MFNLFALAKDDTGAINNESLIRDLKQKLRGVEAYHIYTKDLHMPKTTIVVMDREGWEVRFFIRPGENMVLSPAEVKQAIGKMQINSPPIS